ncbi:hypothetical protein KPH14_008191 [Odynerus spinipes]|uniref:Uncharacterized protein n=1 Tax=Odynerus spinipes TaxID=1348599 RepID=A0AAD9RGC7_9HYME|nr:hypothetical protein KPH14_008191 [Odynerus spinipes]
MAAAQLYPSQVRADPIHMLRLPPASPIYAATGTALNLSPPNDFITLPRTFNSKLLLRPDKPAGSKKKRGEGTLHGIGILNLEWGYGVFDLCFDKKRGSRILLFDPRAS